MVTVNTSELTGAALDWAVAVVLELPSHNFAVKHPDIWTPLGIGSAHPQFDRWSPSTKWAQGGHIIDSYKPFFSFCNGKFRCAINHAVQLGETYLIAICRAVVAAKLGNTVEIPQELLE